VGGFHGGGKDVHATGEGCVREAWATNSNAAHLVILDMGGPSIQPAWIGLTGK
jgi:hypothetical protein